MSELPASPEPRTKVAWHYEFVTVGMDVLGRVLVVCWTWRNDEVCLISARKANAHERDIYEKDDDAQGLRLL